MPETTRTAVGDVLEPPEALAEEGGKPGRKKRKKLSPKARFFIYFAVIIVLTGLALFISLYHDFSGVIEALSRTDYRYFLLILAMVVVAYLIEGLVIFIFVRLYTRHYYYHQAAAAAMVGAFYSSITPGASGGQIMQVYTLRKQGVEVSNGTSIMIMSFIVYQLALIFLGVIAVFFQWDLIQSIGSFEFDVGSTHAVIPAIPMTILGFILNISIIVFLLFMSYSRKVHNFVMNHGIRLLAKLKIVKNPDSLRESLRVQVENFKIELRRLLSNIPIFVLVFFCFLTVLIIRFSIPYVAGIALDGFGRLRGADGTLLLVNGQVPLSTGQLDFKSFWDAVFLSSYHQMTTGLIPLPGSAGISEYFFNIIFKNYYVSAQVTTAAQIIWRFSGFHLVVLVSGIVSAAYRASPHGEQAKANRRSFVTLQLETFEIRKATSDTLYETGSLSVHEIKKRLRKLGKGKAEKRREPPPPKVKKIKPQKAAKIRPTKKRKSSENEHWIEIKTGDD